MTIIKGIAEAQIERKGDISVIIQSKQEPKVMTIAVADDVHTVRIELAWTRDRQ
jgi:hypothetical protein